MVIVDDVCTTGASTVQAIEAAREYGFEIVGVMCLVEREEAKAARTSRKQRRQRLSWRCSQRTMCEPSM